MFIDSDHLTDLDRLFDVVRCRTGYLVVYLTRDTLKRPWCAGEITVAFSTHRRVITIKTPAYLAPESTDLEPNNIKTFLADGPNLVEYGISSDVISKALSWVASADILSVNLDAQLAGQEKFQRLAGELLSASSSTPKTTSREALKRDLKGAVVISSLRGYDEATAAVGILISKIGEGMIEFAAGGVAALCDFPAPEQLEGSYACSWWWH